MNVKNFCPLGRLKQLKSRIDKIKNRTENVFYVWWAMKFKNSDNLKTLKTFGKDPEQLLWRAYQISLRKTLPKTYIRDVEGRT